MVDLPALANPFVARMSSALRSWVSGITIPPTPVRRTRSGASGGDA